MSERDPSPSFWQAWQEPPTFLESASDVRCVVMTSEGPIAETLHPLVYGTVGVLIGAALVGVIAMHEMKLLLLRAKADGFSALPPVHPVAPVLPDGVQLQESPATASGKREQTRRAG